MEKITWSTETEQAPAIQTSGLTYGQDIAVAGWCFKEFNIVPFYINRAFGIVRDGKLVGAAIFSDWTGFNLNFSIWTHAGLTRDEFSTITRVAIFEMGVERVTVHIRKNNKKLSRLLLRAGAVAEGVLQCYYGRERLPKNAAIQYVFFKEQLLKAAKQHLLQRKMN